MGHNWDGYENRELANCRCQVITKQDELTRLLKEFPDPRNKPAEAVDALHRIRKLREEIKQCHGDLTNHAANQGAQN